MHVATLKKVGGSVMLTLPPVFLDTLNVTAGSTVGMSIDHGQLIVKPQKRRRYSLAELLAQCDPSAPLTHEDKEWLGAPAVGREEI
jgi:antitoxin ChpS